MHALGMEHGEALSPNLHRNGVIFHAVPLRPPWLVDRHESKGFLRRSPNEEGAPKKELS